MLMILKKFILFGIVFLAGVFWFSQHCPAEEIIVDNLPQSQLGQFPLDWKNFPFQKNRTRRVYIVSENSGHKYIQAVDKKNISVPIFKDFNWDIQKYPYLKFKWRARILPEGAKEAHPDTNDSACGVYVGFSRTHALKYVWSTLLTPGSYWAKDPAKFYIISLEMGPKHLNQWQEVTVNVPQDYQRYFQRPLEKNPIGIGLLTDGNAVKKPAACDYTDFRISDQP